ncbi:unnamed protein product [Schistosoma mattheei]|uniref:Uncharacterized protein n=1 Tax=Schistosoma mattheei TaxID=31246 RepID=A0A3P8G3G8_9TREM|nr:unnamed protein product [Schistosoma mattheei]
MTGWLLILECIPPTRGARERRLLLLPVGGKGKFWGDPHDAIGSYSSKPVDII